MRRVPIFILLQLLLILTSSCSTTSEPDVTVNEYSSPIDFSMPEFGPLLDTFPKEGKPLFFASVKRMKTRSDELPQCLIDAAEQASKFTAVKATAKFYSEKVNSSIKYMRDLDVYWDRDLAVEMIDRLTVREIFQDTYGTYMIAELEGELISIPYIPTAKRNGRPGWTSSIPDIPGYRVSVGIALQTGYVADSFRAADDQALEDLARQISVEILTGRKNIENSRGTALVQTNLEISKVIIAEFYILDRWRSPDGLYYYSLAAAPILGSGVDD